MLLDRFQLSEAAAAGDAEAKIAPIKINNDPTISFRSPFEYIYARYDRRPDLQVNRQDRVGIFCVLCFEYRVSKVGQKPPITPVPSCDTAWCARAEARTSFVKAISTLVLRVL